MKINNKVIEVMREFNIRPDDGICYLISLFHNYKPSYIPDTFKTRMNATGIYEEKKGSIHWNVPLYDGQETAFEWVNKEYCQMFREVKPENGAYPSECIKRMKKLFAENPEIRKDEILGATKLYLSNTEKKYIRKPHFFIEKGKGLDKIQDILAWIDTYKSLEKKEQGRIGLNNTLQ